MASDSFTSPDLTPLTIHNPSWVLNQGNFRIFSNRVTPNAPSNVETAAHFTGAATSPDQFAQITIAQLTDYAPLPIQIGVAVRCAGAGIGTYYGYYVDFSSRWLFKMVSGGWTQFSKVTVQTAIGDVIRLEVSGNVLTPKINGVLDPLIGPVTDTSIVSGLPGISGYMSATDVAGDEWSGGNLLAGPSPPVNLAFNEAELSWIANTEQDLAGYKVYWGTVNGGPYPNVTNVGNVTRHIVSGLANGLWFFVVTAYDTSGNESLFSAQVSKLITTPLVNLFLPVILMPSIQVIKHAQY